MPMMGLHTQYRVAQSLLPSPSRMHIASINSFVSMPMLVKHLFPAMLCLAWPISSNRQKTNANIFRWSTTMSRSKATLVSDILFFCAKLYSTVRAFLDHLVPVFVDCIEQRRVLERIWFLSGSVAASVRLTMRWSIQAASQVVENAIVWNDDRASDLLRTVTHHSTGNSLQSASSKAAQLVSSSVLVFTCRWNSIDI